MARKNLLEGLISAQGSGNANAPSPAAAPLSAFSPSTAPRMNKGAIGAVGQSIAELKSRAVFEVAPELIDNAGLEDRIGGEDDGISALAESMAEYGQQVPVLLRKSPAHEGRYEVVYGRRRVAALKQAGLPVKAILRELNDRDLMIAQGQENALRKDLSFIERANFARQMRDAGFERKVICDALAVDKTVISRMLSVADALPTGLLHAIGAAPSVGRDRWLELVERIRDRDIDAVINAVSGETSDQRFEAIFRKLAPRRPARPKEAAPEAILGAGHRIIGEFSRKDGALTLSFNPQDSAGFDEWLLANLAELHQEFLGKGQKP